MARTLGGEKSFVSAVQIWCGVSNTASSTAFNNWLDKKTNTKEDKNTKTDKNMKTKSDKNMKTKSDKDIHNWVEVDLVISNTGKQKYSLHKDFSRNLKKIT